MNEDHVKAQQGSKRLFEKTAFQGICFYKLSNPKLVHIFENSKKSYLLPLNNSID